MPRAYVLGSIASRSRSGKFEFVRVLDEGGIVSKIDWMDNTCEDMGRRSNAMCSSGDDLYFGWVHQWCEAKCGVRASPYIARSIHQIHLAVHRSISHGVCPCVWKEGRGCRWWGW